MRNSVLWRTVGFFLFLLIGLSNGRSSFAQSAYETTKQQAADAYRAKKYEKAAQLYLDAFAIEPRGNLLYNIALAYEKAGKTQEAVEFYERFNDAVPDSPQRGVALRKIGELKLALASQFVNVTVSSDPVGGYVFVDDRSKGALGTTPLTFQILPGQYKIIVELKGFEPTSEYITVEAGQPNRLDLKMLDARTVGSLALLITEPDAMIIVDGRKLGRSPLNEPLRVTAGAHKVKVVKPGFLIWQHTIQVEAQKETRQKVDLLDETMVDLEKPVVIEPAQVSSTTQTPVNQSEGGAGIWPWVTVGVGGAALAGALVTGLSAHSLYDQLDEKKSSGELIAQSDIDTGHMYVLTTNVLLGVGSAAVVGGLLWWWFTRDEGSENAKKIGAMPSLTTDGGAAVSVMGSF